MLRHVLLRIEERADSAGAVVEMIGDEGDGGDGGGFGAQDARAERDMLPVVCREERHLFGRPAAFGTDGEGVGESAEGIW